MLFGPMPVVFAEKLRQLLQEHGGQGKIYYSPELKEAFQESLTQRPISQYPHYEGKDLVHIEIETKDLLIVRGELEKMGFSIPQREHKPIEGEDFLCPKCDFVSDQPGICPDHGLTLLEFSEWVENKRQQGKWVARVVAWLAIAIILVLSALHYMDRM